MVAKTRPMTAPTRRECVASGGTIATVGLLAGCTSATGGASEETEAGTDEADGESYTVTMEPMGDVEFESVPERWIAYDGGYADMAVALGRIDGMTGIGHADRYYTGVYDELPGVEIDLEAIEAFPEVRTKEEFYELDCDVHLYDPEMLINWFDWSADDVTEITDAVAPFFGNLIFRRSDDWHEYEYYTLYEAFEKLAAVFDERERYAAFADLHDELRAEIDSRLPPEAERPEVFLTYDNTLEPSEFSPYRLDDGGTSTKQWRDLGPVDALEGTDVEHLSTTERGALDYEGLLDLDPEVILMRGHERKSATEFRETVLAYMEDHPVASLLTAVENGRVYRGGYLNQGPIHNLFLIERGAKQLYPEEFGSVTDDTELFDRDRVADAVTGAN